MKISESPPDYVLSAQQIARDVAGAAHQDRPYRDASKQVSVPVPLSLLAQIEVLARRAGDSRGAMISALARIGVEVTLAQLPPDASAEVIDQVEARQAELYAEFDPQGGV